MPEENNENWGYITRSVTYHEKNPTSLPSSSWMIGLVMKLSGGFITSERGAKSVLIVLVVLAGVISLLIIFGGGSTGSSGISAPPGSEVIYPPNAPPRLAQPLMAP